jgi:hypothetical protein
MGSRLVRLVRICALLICAATYAPALTAQTLGDLARQEAERRKAVTPGKVFTNDSLRPEPAPSPSAKPAAADGKKDESEAKKDAVKPDDVKKDDAKNDAKAGPVQKDEAYWRKRLQDEREALDRAKVLVIALQGRVGSLQTDFVNRDDPAARAQVAEDRQRVTAELDRIRIEIDQRTKTIAGIQEEARRAGVPAAWYR